MTGCLGSRRPGCRPGRSPWHPPGPAAAVIKDNSENVWIFAQTGKVLKWVQASNTVSQVATLNVWQGGQPACYDSMRNRVFRVPNGPTSWGILNLGNVSADFTTLKMGGATIVGNSEGNVVYDPMVDCFWYAPCLQ